MTTNQFRQLAAYNRWANARLYAAASPSSSELFEASASVAAKASATQNFTTIWRITEIKIGRMTMVPFQRS